MPTKIQLRRGTASQWTSANPTLASGEFGVETDTAKVKLGNGTTAWTSLGYFGDISSIDNIGDVTITDASNGEILQWNGTAWVNATIDALPSQTSHSGQFLTTDGTTASWATVDALPSQSGHSGQYLTTDGSTASWASVTTDPKPDIFLLMGA